MAKVNTYAVTMTVEFTKLVKVRAQTEKEAFVEAERKVRGGQNKWVHNGYSIGDIHFHDADWVNMTYDGRYKTQ